MMTSYSCRGSGEAHCSCQPLWPRIASRAMAKTEYFRMRSGLCRNRLKIVLGRGLPLAKTPIPPLRCLRRRLPFCAAGFGWSPATPTCDDDVSPATPNNKDKKNVQSHQQGRHRHRRQLRHRPGDRKTVRRARREGRRRGAPPERARCAGRRNRRRRRRGCGPGRRRQGRGLCQGAGRTGRREIRRPRHRLQQCRHRRRDGSGLGPVAGELAGRHRHQPDRRLPRRQVPGAGDARARRRIDHLHLDLRRPHGRHARA